MRGLAGSQLSGRPPVTSTLPLASRDAVWPHRRAVLRLPVAVHVAYVSDRAVNR